jgi:hypothetical protein
MDRYLTGRYRIRVGRWALQESQKWLPRIRDRALLRRHALKLRFWPENHPADDQGKILDLDWSWIQGFPGKRIGELRIHDTIGGCDNLRLVFFVPPAQEDAKQFSEIWILSVFQKKRDDFTIPQLKNFAARRTMILERFYGKAF